MQKKLSITKISYLFISVLTIFLLAACGKDSDKASTTADKENLKDKSYEINVGYSQSGGAPLLDIGVQEKFFEKEHLKVNLIPFANSADGLNALQAGKIDVGLSFGTAAPLTFIAKGSDFSIIGGHLEGGHPILVKEENKDKYKTLADYKGKKVGTIRLFTSDIVFRSALEDAGIDWRKDLQIVEFKTGQQLLEAVSSGKVDVAVSASSLYAAAKEAKLVPVGWSNDLNPKHVCCRVVTRTELLNKDGGEAYKRFLKGLIQAERVKTEQPEKAVTAARSHFKLDDKTIDSIVNEKHAHYSADPNKKEVLKMWDQMKAIGYVQNVDKLDINKYINVDLYEKALEELIKENPNDAYYKKQLARFNKQDL